jgi:Domain of unknown function (DUF4388)
MAIEGDLADVSLPNILQMICTERRSLALFVERRGQEAAVHFASGEIVHAALGELEGEEAVYRLLAWPDGAFRLTSGGATPAQTIRRDWKQLLVEGMRHAGERPLNGEEQEDALPGVDPNAELRLTQDLFALLATLYRDWEALNELRFRRRPEAGIALLARMVNLAVERAELTLSPGTPEVSLAPALRDVIAELPQACLLQAQRNRNRLSAFTITSFYRGPSTNPENRGHLARQACRASVRLIERYLSLLGRQLHGRLTADRWRELASLLLADLRETVEAIRL